MVNEDAVKLLEEKEQEIKELKKEIGALKQTVKMKEWNIAALQTTQKPRGTGLLPNILFYLVIICGVFGAALLTGKNGQPRNIFGHSYFTVLTGSMEREIPRGSLVITRKMAPEELRAGDNITFLKDQSTTVTHKIVEIYENYDGKGTRGFRTRGVENTQPDRDVVDASNVVGKVVFTLPKVGAALSVLSDHLIYCFVFLGLILLLSFSMQVFFKIRREEKEERMGAQQQV